MLITLDNFALEVLIGNQIDDDHLHMDGDQHIGLFA